LAFALDRKIKPLVARAGDVEAALDRLYGAIPEGGENTDLESADEADVERLKDLASDAPVVRAVNGIITRATEARASDIHIEPAEDGVEVRFRIDGALKEIETLPAHLKSAVISRIKVMSGLDIAERRLPQDGRLRIAVRGHEIDLRVATSPTIHGETVVLRILDRSNLALDFETLGFDPKIVEPFVHVLRQPHGIVLVTGPTGSGKTTTLYAALSILNSTDRKILTIEDPIEYRLARINQTQVKPQIGLTFAAALRSFLRQDPDVMMVGEIRDLETAEVAVQAALTGHTILSTLHTNDAASTVTRLLDMGVEPFLITSTLNAVLAQRLVRRLCAQCRKLYEPSDEMLKGLAVDRSRESLGKLYRAEGCDACGRTGFRGRLAVTELLVMDDEIARPTATALPPPREPSEPGFSKAPRATTSSSASSGSASCRSRRWRPRRVRRTAPSSKSIPRCARASPTPLANWPCCSTPDCRSTARSPFAWRTSPSRTSRPCSCGCATACARAIRCRAP
jgi:general secretion pathway protein E